MDTGIFPEKEFRKITVKMIQDLRNTMEKMQEMLSKVLEELKNNQIEMNNTLEGINSRIMEADGEGNGTPLQYSCLENPMDGGAW